MVAAIHAADPSHNPSQDLNPEKGGNATRVARLRRRLVSRLLGGAREHVEGWGRERLKERGKEGLKL